MGFRQAAVLSSVSFFLGVLLICLNVDYRILFTPLTDDVLRDGFEFYTTFYNSPPAIKALLHAVMGVGALGLCGKLNRWDESAIFFDGSSLAAYVFAMAVYISVGIPPRARSPCPSPGTRAGTRSRRSACCRRGTRSSSSSWVRCSLSRYVLC
ncbi:ER membrane protein SH3-domain-containing protein [Fomitopsis serialis]|uniref:ER membrane protein SH3-domain-containing protein n=1 Tax=Fomitopsis serialis TaxID=139415 RepID=UPI002007F63A|nr:ER membrane protein SH3-domain-containing protein [Neoantrodia serialis]KAH9933348.1 ER membrane protein SH3-domain-containing protein [Neoantrodia serialis]